MVVSKKGSLGARLIRMLVVLLGGIILLSLALYAAVRLELFGELPTTTELAALRNEEATLILAENGAVIGKVFAKDRTNISYEVLPRHLVNALIATEDQRFFEHQGVDTWSYLRVLFRSILLGDASGGGGSTISQQVIKNLYGRERHGLLTTPVNKIKEAIVARRLERVYSKEDVLTLYFNSVPFGENLYGVETAAQRFFGKRTEELNMEEGAVLVGMLKANTTFNPRLHPERSRERRDQVLVLMQERGHLSQAAADSLRDLPLRLNYHGSEALDDYGYFAAQVAREVRGILAGLARKGQPHDIEKDGLRIHTTLDTALQRSALRAARAHLEQMQPKLDRELRTGRTRRTWERTVAKDHGRAWKLNERRIRDVFRWHDAPADTISYRDSVWHTESMLQAAVLLMDPSTGKIRAWVGGNDHRTLPFDQVRSHRPIASTIKPVIYAAAFENGVGPCDHFSNEERSHRDHDGWSPRNYDGSSGGTCTAWYALSRSMNLPTVDLYLKTGSAPMKDLFTALGLPAAGVKDPATALGAVDISLLEIVRAYGAFAARGRIVRPRTIERIDDAEGNTIWKAPAVEARPAMGALTAATITGILQRAVNEGTAASLRSHHHIQCELAGKTGTSQDFGDAWFVGYTPGIVIGAWVGARDRSIHFTSNLGSGAHLALPIVGRMLNDMERSRATRSHYLKPFNWLAAFEVDLDCPPTRTGGGQLFQFLTGPKSDGAEVGRDGAPRKTPPPKEKKESFWRKLFPRRERR